MSDQFLTIAMPTEGYYMDRGSKFLSYAFPIESEAVALIHLQKIRKEHPKARHFCTAMRLFPDASLERSSDDGEPSGSAGKPILGQLIKNNLTNVMVIVVRYFGGSKLGVPGLIEAYKTSAANAIASGIIIQRKVYAKVRFELPYESFSHLVNHFKQNNVPVFESIFSEKAIIVIGLAKSSVEALLLNTLRQFSQLDFNRIEDYAKHIGMKIEILNEQEIL